MQAVFPSRQVFLRQVELRVPHECEALQFAQFLNLSRRDELPRNVLDTVTLTPLFFHEKPYF